MGRRFVTAARRRSGTSQTARSCAPPLTSKTREATPKVRPGKGRGFDAEFRVVFEERFEALFGYLDRLAGDGALASDIAQEAFVRLYARGRMPDRPASWLVTVANNLFRSSRRDSARRRKLRAMRPATAFTGDPAPEPDEALERAERRRAAESALARLEERERRLLLLRHEGFSYREIAQALDLAESSVGSLLLRAKRSFRAAYEERDHASR